MRLVLENVGIIEKADIEINGLTVIAGNNDSGKSTVGKIAYSLTKSFEDFELNYEKSKSQIIHKQIRDFYVSLRRDIDLKENKEIRRHIERFMFYRRANNKNLLEPMNQLRELINKDSFKLDPKIKLELNNRSNKINKSFSENESKKFKILKSIKKILKSEFRNQISNLLANESKISVWEGKNAVVNLIVKNDEILQDESRKIDEIFPFDSSVFIETPFVLTYKDALEDSDDIYHVFDLLSKLMKPNLIGKGGSLNIDKIIGGGGIIRGRG